VLAAEIALVVAWVILGEAAPVGEDAVRAYHALRATWSLPA